jgi:6-phosphofructokinase 1
MDFRIKTLGEPEYDSPLSKKFPASDRLFMGDERKMHFNVFADEDRPLEPCGDNCFELAGPREKLYFDPEKSVSALITCGGLCPGLNDVIRSIVMETYYMYGSQSILGIRNGYNGLNPGKGYEPVELTPEYARDIHKIGGTVLGSSRGGTDDMDLLVDTIEKLGINILYTIGGDGTLRGAHRIAEIAKERGTDLAVIGVPKTIDNDISFIQKSFGFETAFSKAVEAISSAHVEATGAPNGIGLVKLMGRHSGFIAANASLAMNDVNFLLVPEVEFDLEGDNGFLKHLEERMLRRKHAVICVAEGAGQRHLVEDKSSQKRDRSGNIVLEDIGIFLKNRIKEYFARRGVEANLKYIDPSYIIRSTPANPADSVFCTLLGQNAVHAAMAGKTDMIVGQWNNIFTHLPIELAISRRKKLNASSGFWYSVLQATGQPVSMINE